MKQFLVLILFTFTFLPIILTFNVSPNPNIILKSPSVNQERSSYFGFSINLRKNHILIGAPRANSTLQSQVNILEPGIIYKCSFDGRCETFILDELGNNYVNYYHQNYLDAELKEFRLLGFSMDGHDTEDDIFVACAPKQLTVAPHANRNIDYYMFGACYYSKNSKSNFPMNNKIAPLRISSRLLFSNREPDYMFGESGFSAHIPDTKDEIMAGCPGVGNWKGSVNQFSLNWRNRNHFYQGLLLEVNYVDSLDEQDYFGYALTSGKLLMPYSSLLYYVSSAPRNKYHGSVLIFSISNHFKIHKIFKGNKYGSYFGYALVCDDFNNDGKLDLAVSAPFYSENGYFDNGAVYIYLNQATDGHTLSFLQLRTLKPKFEESNTRFGTALGKIGDINGDGFNDLAISGNSNDKGVVYIYHGSKNQGMTLSQKIQVSDEISMFGFSISRGVDIDGNFYPDIAIGAPESENVFIFKSYPVINIQTSLIASKTQLESNDKISIKACISFKSKYNLNHQIQFATKLFIESPVSLRYLKVFDYSQFASQNEINCKNETFAIIIAVQEIQKPVIFKYKIELVNSIPKSGTKFCQTCVALDPRDKKDATLSVPVNTGCRNKVCRPDLRLIGTFKDSNKKLIKGTVNDVSIDYRVSNYGEPAYSTQLSLLIPDFVRFIAIPSTCKRGDNDGELTCLVNSEKPLKNGENFNFDITLDVSKSKENFLNISAELSCAGAEVNERDNFASINITLEEQSELEVFSQSVNHIDVTLQRVKNLEDQKVKYTYKLFNYGPSPVGKFKFEIFIPHNFKKAQENVEIIKLESIQCVYKNEFYDIEWNDDNKKISNENQTDDKFLNFPKNQTILIDCDQSYVECVKAEMTILNFERSTESFIEVVLNFAVIKKSINIFLNKTKPRMLFRPKFFSQQINEKLKTVKIIDHDFAIVIQKDLPKKTPLSILITSVLGGLALLFILIMILYKFEFFTRKVKQELKQKRQETNADAGQSIQAFENTHELT